MKNFDNNYEMNSLFESEDKYDIRKIAKIAFDNLHLWVDAQSFTYLKNEVQKNDAEGGTFEDKVEIMHDYFNKYIQKFFSLLVHHNHIELNFLQENRDAIIYNIIEQYVPMPKNPNEPGQSTIDSREDPEEDKDLAQAMRKSREITQKPKTRDYSEMTRFEIEKEINDAIDRKDYEKLKKLQPFVRESLQIKIQNILNEGLEIDHLLNNPFIGDDEDLEDEEIENDAELKNSTKFYPKNNFNENIDSQDESYIMPTLDEGCNCGGGLRKIFPKLIKTRPPKKK